jgi:hypothetical protein
MFGGIEGKLIVSTVAGVILLEEKIDLRDEMIRELNTTYKGIAIASLKLPSGEFLVCKFYIN